MDFTSLVNDANTLILSFLILLSFIALCLWYGLGWLRMGIWKDDKTPKGRAVQDRDLPSVSVVMVAHNAAEALKGSLPYLLEQDYPDYEVVVVDYVSSNEDTKFVLRVCSENYPHLKSVIFPQDVNMFRGKKYPLSIGIKSARKEVILLTEPECVPASFDWIREMMTGYSHNTKIVLGYSKVNASKGLLNALERFDNVTFSARYLGGALHGFPFTGTGRNLSFGREFFFRQGAFISHYSFPEGADDLFVNGNATARNVGVVFRPGAETVRDGSADFGQWHRERTERMRSRRHYPVKDKLRLAFYPFMQILFIVSLVMLWVGGIMPWFVLTGVLALRLIWETLCFYFLSKRFEMNKLWFFSVFFELYFLFSNTFLWFVALFAKKR